MMTFSPLWLRKKPGGPQSQILAALRLMIQMISMLVNKRVPKDNQNLPLLFSFRRQKSKARKAYDVLRLPYSASRWIHSIAAPANLNLSSVTLGNFFHLDNHGTPFANYMRTIALILKTTPAIGLRDALALPNHCARVKCPQTMPERAHNC